MSRRACLSAGARPVGVRRIHRIDEFVTSYRTRETRENMLLFRHSCACRGGTDADHVTRRTTGRDGWSYCGVTVEWSGRGEAAKEATGDRQSYTIGGGGGEAVAWHRIAWVQAQRANASVSQSLSPRRKIERTVRRHADSRESRLASRIPCRACALALTASAAYAL